MTSSSLSRPLLAGGWALIAATIIPRLSNLYQIAHPTGRKLLGRQLLLLLLLRFKWIRSRIPSIILAPPTLVLPLMTIGALLFRLSRRSALSSTVLRCLVAYGAVPVVTEALDKMWEDVADADHPALIAMPLGLLMNEPSAAAVILLMLSGGEALEDYAMDRAQEGIHKLLLAEPGVATRIDVQTGKTSEVAATELLVGDELKILQYESVQVDCVLNESISSPGARAKQVEIDESSVTGEVFPQVKMPGDTMLAGSRLLSLSPVMASVVHTYNDSTVALLKKALAAGLQNKASIERKSIRMAGLFTPFTMALAACALKVSEMQQLGSVACWGRVLSVLMAATPCPASIGVPVAFLSGMSLASGRGMSIKSGVALGELGKVSVVVLDKTGTLTHGQPLVETFHVDQAGDELVREAIELVASLEVSSVHPIAKAVIEYANSQNVQLFPYSVEDVQLGGGMCGIVDDKHTVRIGTAQYVGMRNEERPERSPPRLNIITDKADSGRLCAHFDIDSGRLTGWFTMSDRPRAGCAQMVQQLQHVHSLRCIILSGDRSGGLERFATDIGIQEFHTCMPHEKAQIVDELTQNGEVVMMVGDGVNDAPALAAAAVGVSVGASNLASDAADIVFLNQLKDPTESIVELITLGREVRRVATNGVVGGMALSVIQMMAAAAGFLHPRTSAMMQEVVDLLTLLHSMQLIYKKVLD